MPDSNTLQHLLQAARQRLERAGISASEAAIDADVLARHALGGWERGRLLAALREPCPPGLEPALEAVVRRRERREPAGYITGRREFWEIEMEVGPGVLVPRPETEILVEETIARLAAVDASAGRLGAGPDAAGPRIAVADVGTGSGCIAVALARWLPGASLTAIDASGAALAVARRNAARHGVAARVALLQSDLLAAVRGPFDAIVSNPPYVPTADLESLQPEIRLFEPAGALDGGADGLEVIRRLVPSAAERLKPGGWLLFEFGFGQADGVRAVVAAERRLGPADVRADLAGIPRVAAARRLG